MSCIVLDIELTDQIFIKEYLGVVIDGKVQGYSFCPPKKYKPTKQAFCCTRNLHGIVWNSARLDYSELSNILSRAVKVNILQKEQKNAMILAMYWINSWKIWMITAVPQFKM